MKVHIFSTSRLLLFFTTHPRIPSFGDTEPLPKFHLKFHNAEADQIILCNYNLVQRKISVPHTVSIPAFSFERYSHATRKFKLSNFHTKLVTNSLSLARHCHTAPTRVHRTFPPFPPLPISTYLEIKIADLSYKFEAGT